MLMHLMSNRYHDDFLKQTCNDCNFLLLIYNSASLKPADNNDSNRNHGANHGYDMYASAHSGRIAISNAALRKRSL